MRRPYRLILVFLPLLLAACSALGLGDAPSPLTEVEYGTFRDGALVAKTDGVPREIGLSFGFRVKLSDDQHGPVKAKIVTVTPGLLDPASSTPQTQYVSETTFEPGQTYDVFFTFSKPWEMAAGRWELRVETENAEPLSHTFDIYDPEAK